MEDTTKPNFRPGDRVQLVVCPRYPSLESHTARVTGEPVSVENGGWAVPVKYWCMGRQTAVVMTDRIVKIRSIKVKKPAIITGAVLLFTLFIGMWIAGNFNSLVAMNEDVDNSWAKVETQYQRRFDLVGNLVESVKGSQAQESEVFGKIADARKQYTSAQATGDENGQAQAASNIETNLALIPRLQEAYPELKSNQNVQNLMGELTGTENGIAGVRDRYNDTVTNYNKSVQSFPKNIFAGMFGYKERAQFKANAAAAEAPKVDFSKQAPKE